MPVDTFMAYSGTYPSVEDALTDYDAVHALHTDAGLIDAYDAAVVERNADGKVKIVKKHETPDSSRRRRRGWSGSGHGSGHRSVSGCRHRWRDSSSPLAAAVRCWVHWRAMPLPV